MWPSRGMSDRAVAPLAGIHACDDEQETPEPSKPKTGADHPSGATDAAPDRAKKYHPVPKAGSCFERFSCQDGEFPMKLHKGVQFDRLSG